ncbi:rubrerythrin [Desulfonema ishimotonii]|uniref:Rubrerythrin n=1 Tax=Desulfonema ishimotonii TaxID=45657 RepID=A0A401G0H0_9BACT|nr:ferritin family protein [Desulfonema ishimotonii]GBC62714.1 rubrerythrin [Desulfonema ishimotonii]
MTLEEAIRTAIGYEKKIRDLYQAAAESADDPVGRHVFQMLADDEQNHVAYLESRLAQWEKDGKISLETLEKTLPSAETVRSALEKLEERMDKEDRKDEKQMLSKALQTEVETSNFYQKMVAELSGDGQKMFARFLEIENEHIDIVQAELDYLTHTGYWFDIKEFDME